MSKAEAVVDSQPPGYLPVILREELIGFVCDVVDAVARGFLVVAGDTKDLVRIRIAGGVQGITARHELQLAVGIIVGGLCVADPFPEETRLERVRTHNFGEGIAQAGHVLVGV